ncbi:hydroxymethylbilane synthase [Thermodesulfitimonas autotrophica]|uniref:hydroxymethylbilane synthase n=1 Tax=Thermodesulfitimonas autotrophica TaxID=1894989 RepID=UPI002FE091AC
MARTVRVGTRGSTLALAQTRIVIRKLAKRWPDYRFEVVKIKTTGDKILDVALAKIGDKGLFTKELEVALLKREIDLAVHSMKDVPTVLPEGLVIGAVLPREYPGDVLVSRTGKTLGELPPGARVGTSSLRRQAQLRYYRPDLALIPVRGNLTTRLNKLKAGDFDALVLAWAGLARLGLEGSVTERLPYAICLPAVSQGAIGVEIRADDPEIARLVGTVDDAPSRAEVVAERAFMRRLEGGCQVPIGAVASVTGTVLTIEGMVADLEGSRLYRDRMSGQVAHAAETGVQLAEKLLSSGAGAVLSAIREGAPGS